MSRAYDLFSNGTESETTAMDRQLYFRELFRLQGGLVELQDWIIHEKLKVVVIFEGRDAAGVRAAIASPTRISTRTTTASTGRLLGCHARRHSGTPDIANRDVDSSTWRTSRTPMVAVP